MDNSAVDNNAKRKHSLAEILRVAIPSFLGIMVFFVPITIAEKNTILLDHLVIWCENLLGENSQWYALLLIIGGSVLPIMQKFWRQGFGSIVFTLFKFIAGNGEIDGHPRLGLGGANR